MAYSFGVKRLELQTKLGKNYSRLNDNQDLLSEDPDDPNDVKKSLLLTRNLIDMFNKGLGPEVKEES